MEEKFSKIQQDLIDLCADLELTTHFISLADGNKRIELKDLHSKEVEETLQSIQTEEDFDEIASALLFRILSQMEN